MYDNFMLLLQQQQHQKSIKVKSCFKQRFFLLLFEMPIDKKILQRLEQQTVFIKCFSFLPVCHLPKTNTLKLFCDGITEIRMRKRMEEREMYSKETRAQFHQRSTYSFYTHRYRMRKKDSQVSSVIWHF